MKGQDKPYKLFISHSSKDKKYVEALVEILKSIGIRVDSLFASDAIGPMDNMKKFVVVREQEMIITQTTFRISFFGGGTDMRELFEEYGGAVLSTTFDKCCYVTVRHLPRFFDYSTKYVPFEFESGGTRVVHYTAENYEPQVWQ